MNDIILKNGIIVEPSRIDFDEAAVSAKIDQLIDPYVDVTPEVISDIKLKEARMCRADLNAISQDLNDARKAVKREYLKPLTAFENKVKDLDKKIQEPKKIIDQVIKEREQKERDDRFAEMADDYLTMAPALAEVIAPEDVIERQWTNASFSRSKADDLLAKKVQRIASDLKTIDALTLEHPQEVKRYYLDELSLQKALQYDKVLSERDESVSKAFQYCKTRQKPEQDIKTIYITGSSKELESIIAIAQSMGLKVGME